jgi:hypothetical protein
MSENFLKNTGALSLESTTKVAAKLMAQIQGLVDSVWNINYSIPGDGGNLSGSPNNLNYSFSQTYEDSGTIVPGIPAYTITPSYVVPAVVSPAVPGCCTVNWCGPWSNCTTEIPGTPAYTITPAYTVPAVVSPAIPALTGGYSTELDIDVTIQGISNALTPLFSSVTFTSGTMTAPEVKEKDKGLAIETVTYNLDQEMSGSAIYVSGRAAFDNLSVDIGGVTTNFGDISTGTITMSPVPNIPIYFDAIIVIPSYNTTPDRVANGLAYEIFPQATSVTVDNLAISTGLTAVADFINEDLLSYLTTAWNTIVAPLYTAVGATAPTAPSQTLADTISSEAETAQQAINTTAESALNYILSSELGIIQPYVQAVTAAVWDYSDYPIVPAGYYDNANLSYGLFSGTDISNSSFVGANCAQADFSNTDLTGCDFTGANLSGANFSGAMGFVTPTAEAAAQMITDIRTQSQVDSEPVSSQAAGPEQPFYGAVLFGTDLTGANLDLKGAFYDRGTKFASDYSPSESGLLYFSPEQFVAGNKKLIKAFEFNFAGAAGAFAADRAACGCSNKQGLRTDLMTGLLMLDNFNEDRYYSRLSASLRERTDDYLASHDDVSFADFLATRAILQSQTWSKIQRSAYVFSNSDLIKEFGGVKQALKNAPKHYIQYGMFEGRRLNNEDLYAGYLSANPSVLNAIGGAFDPASLAHHFLTVGYAAGHTVPAEFM